MLSHVLSLRRIRYSCPTRPTEEHLVIFGIGSVVRKATKRRRRRLMRQGHHEHKRFAMYSDNFKFRVPSNRKAKTWDMRLPLSSRCPLQGTQSQDGFAISFSAGLLHPLQHAGLTRAHSGMFECKSVRSTRCCQG